MGNKEMHAKTASIGAQVCRILLAVCSIIVWSIWAVVPLAAQTSSESQQLRVIIENIRANEELYKNIEVRHSRQYKLNSRNWSTLRKDAILSRKSAFRSVVQGALVYTQRTDRGSTGEKPINRTETHAYDGEKTRIVVDDSLANEIIGYRENPVVFRPHTWILSRARVYFPLSVFLAGGKELQKQSFAGSYRSAVMKAKYVGEEEVNGVTTLKLECAMFDRAFESKPNTLRHIWVAPSRNYLPVKSVGIVPRYNDRLPLEEVVAHDFKEIHAGIWLPHRYELTVYDEQTLQQDRKMIVSNSEQGIIESASLDPNNGISLFRDIVFPEGSLVYNLDRDKIVSSYINGEPPQQQLVQSKYWTLWFRLAIGSIAIIFICLWLRRRNNPKRL